MPTIDEEAAADLAALRGGANNGASSQPGSPPAVSPSRGLDAQAASDLAALRAGKITDEAAPASASSGPAMPALQTTPDVARLAQPSPLTGGVHLGLSAGLLADQGAPAPSAASPTPAPARTPAPAAPALTRDQVAGSNTFNPFSWDNSGPTGQHMGLLGPLARLGDAAVSMLAPNAAQAHGGPREQYIQDAMAGAAPYLALSRDPLQRAAQVAEIAKLRPLVERYAGQVQQGVERASASVPNPGGYQNPNDLGQPNPLPPSAEYQARMRPVLQDAVRKLQPEQLAAYLRQQGVTLTPLQQFALGPIAAAQRLQFQNVGNQWSGVLKDILLHEASGVVGHGAEEALSPLLAQAGKLVPASVRTAASAVPDAVGRVLNPARIGGRFAGGAAFQGLGDLQNPNLSVDQRIQNAMTGGTSGALLGGLTDVLGEGVRAAAPAVQDATATLRGGGDPNAARLADALNGATPTPAGGPGAAPTPITAATPELRAAQARAQAEAAKATFPFQPFATAPDAELPRAWERYQTPAGQTTFQHLDALKRLSRLQQQRPDIPVRLRPVDPTQPYGMQIIERAQTTIPAEPTAAPAQGPQVTDPAQKLFPPAPEPEAPQGPQGPQVGDTILIDGMPGTGYLRVTSVNGDKIGFERPGSNFRGTARAGVVRVQTPPEGYRWSGAPAPAAPPSAAPSVPAGIPAPPPPAPAPEAPPVRPVSDLFPPSVRRGAAPEAETPPAPAAPEATPEAAPGAPELVALNAGVPLLPQPIANESGALRNFNDFAAARSATTHNLSQLEQASPETAIAARTAASAEPIARTMHRTAVAGIDAAYGRPGASSDFFQALQTSNLLGAADRWEEMARTATDPADAATAQANADLIRHRLAPDLPAFRAFLAAPEFARALDIYKRTIEQPLSEYHAANGGTQLGHLGPADTYFPLTAVDADGNPVGPKATTSRSLPWRTPQNPRNGFRTGLSENYSYDPEVLQSQLRNAVRANTRADLLEQLKGAGLAQDLPPGSPPPPAVSFQGKQYQATTVDTTPVGGNKLALPQWVHDELSPILERSVRPQHALTELGGRVTQAAVAAGPDAVFHAKNLIGTLIGNTPVIGRSLAGNLPFVKGINALAQLVRENPSTPENLSAQADLARLGLLPSATGHSTYSKAYAASTGADLKKFSFEPFLKGPSGMDVKTRLILYRVAKELNPQISDPDLVKFVGQTGTYVSALQGRLQRGLGPIAPFAEGGKQMGMNALTNVTGTTPLPGGTVGQKVTQRLQQQIGGGALGLGVAWVLAYRGYTGRWPWHDPRARLGEIPLKEGDRQSPAAKAIWGPDVRQTAYVNLLGLGSPMTARGLGMLGVKGAANTLTAGGTPGQALEKAGVDQLNALTHPLQSPQLRSLMIAATGAEPHLQNLRDPHTGRLGPSLHLVAQTRQPGIPQLQENFRAASAAMNPLSADIFNEGTSPDAKPPLNYLLQPTGAVGPAVNTNALHQRLQQAAVAASRAAFRAQHPRRR